MMATFPFPVRRLLIAGGFAVVAAAAPVMTAFAAPSSTAPLAADCPAGEEEDLFTGVCVPHTVPNSGSSSFNTNPGGALPAVDGVPCTGANTGECIGLAEESANMPHVTPTVTVGDGR